MKEKIKLKIYVAASVAALLLLMGGRDAIARVTGAIFTTDEAGNYVNANVYDNKGDVYLNGGPPPNRDDCTAAGLPDGDYYFQVTDPSGKVVLHDPTLDPITDRRVTVEKGIIAYYGGLRSTGIGKCGSVTVRLYPYDDTPNPGDEYKVWMTPVSDYEYYGGFVPSKSKTDNFKAPADTVDSDGDGVTNGAEIAMGSDPNNPDTDGDGLTDGMEIDRGTDPNNPDTDGDGLTDAQEVDLGTSPSSADSDGDGLTDGEEINLGTDPNNPDTDGDGADDKNDTCPTNPTCGGGELPEPV